MPKVAENALVKKAMTKVKSCTKKYRKAVRKFYKTSSKLNKYHGKDSKRRASLHKMSEKANASVDTIKDQCNDHKMNLQSMVQSGKVVKEETKTQIDKLFETLDKDEMAWSSNTSSFKSQLNE